MCESEFTSRLALDPAHFGFPAHWLLHHGARLALASSLPLWSGNARGWSVHGCLINAAVAPEAARSLARFFVPAGSARLGTDGRVAVAGTSCTLEVPWLF